jgi:trehalose 2-sulfotransferase
MEGRSSARLGERAQDLAATRYVIVFAVRSGSTLLCNDLTQAGLGAPTEHFQGNSVPGPVASYVERVIVRDAPVFGTKLSWEQTFALLRRLADEEQIRTFDLREAFGDDVRVVRIVRRNKIRQAISAWRAATSGVWHVPTTSLRDEPRPIFESGPLVALMMQLLAEDWLWERHLLDAGIDALTLAYEDYVADRAGTILEVARHIGRPLATPPQLVDRLQPLADRWTDLFEQRLLDELSAPIHPFWGTPGLQGSMPSSLPIDLCVPLPRSSNPVAVDTTRS